MSAREKTEKVSFTPGPWSIERVPIRSAGGSNTCFKIMPMCACIYDDWQAWEKYGVSTAQNEANANLIGAAPDLYAACKAAKDLLIDDLEEPERTVFWKLVNAIQKAEGGSK